MELKIYFFLPKLFDSFIIPLVEQVFEKLEILFHNVDVSFLEVLESNTSTLFMQTIITIIAMFFIIIDFNTITAFCKRQIPQTKQTVVHEAKNYFIKTLPQLILSYGCILFLTFGELFIGFTLLQIQHASILALLIAVLDILPVLGTGTILIPWSIINIIIGNYKLSTGIFILYIVITIIRNIIEPKLIGKQMGLYPILTLASMLVGLNLFGVMGIFALPILLSFLKKLNDNWTIQIFK